MIELSEQTIDIIVEGAYFVFRTSSVLNLVDFFDDVSGDLFAPSFAFVEVVDLSDVTQSTRSFVVFSVDESTFHGPPTIQHALCFLAVSCHLKEN